MDSTGKENQVHKTPEKKSPVFPVFWYFLSNPYLKYILIENWRPEVEYYCWCKVFFTNRIIHGFCVLAQSQNGGYTESVTKNGTKKNYL